MSSDFEREVARGLGAAEADIRTIKHDVANLSGKIDGLTTLVGKLTTQQARGLGFFAGAAFIITAAGGLLITFAKLVFGGHP